MNLWEDVYSKHKEGGRAPINPEVQQNHALSNSLDEQMKYSTSRSFEDMYYGNSRKPQTTSRRVQDQEQQSKAPTANQRVQDQEQQSKTPITNQRDQDEEQQQKAAIKKIKSKYVPRRQSGTLSAPYPAILSKMNYGLSDTWSNILIGSEQDIRTLLVCGATRKEGSTIISYHLAMFLSKEYSLKVLYVDTNLNHEPVPKIKNLPGTVFATFRGRNDLKKYRQQYADSGTY
jgi:hypothetical protein